MRIKQHKLILTILLVYTALILFFLFFSFGRFDAAGNHGYRFNLIPSIIYLRFPTISDLEYFQLWFFNFGNFAGFIPFGILIPLLYRCNFFKFISLFFLSILIIETIQMLTFLGSFDIDDAIVNTLGAAVGFCAYKMGVRFTNARRKFAVMITSVVILSIVIVGFSEVLNKSLIKKEGPIIALNELVSNDHAPNDKNLKGFEIGHEKIEPKINLYSSEGDHMEKFTYPIGGKDIVLSLNYGIPDNASNYEGEAILFVDGKVIETYSNHNYGSSEIIIDKVNELTITVQGNIKLWDVTFKEMKYWWN